MALQGSFDTVRSFDGTRIAYAVFAPPGQTGQTGHAAAKGTVVLANGIACSDAYWTFLVPFLQEHGYRSVFFDYRGHGRSGPPKNPNEIGLPSHARDLWRVFDETGISGPVVLAGHSMGVETILEAYRQRPGSVAGLVPIAGPFEHPFHNAYSSAIGHYTFPLVEFAVEPIPWLTRALWKAAGAATGPAYVVGRATRMIYRGADREVMDEYLQHLSRLDPLLFVRMVRAMDSYTARDLLPEIAVPALVIAGKHDVLTPPRQAREMAAIIPDATLEIFEHAGHTLPADDPDRLHEVVLEFLETRVEWGTAPMAAPMAAPLAAQPGAPAGTATS